MNNENKIREYDIFIKKFYRSISQMNYKSALDYLDIFVKSGFVENKNDIMFYLYSLSILVDLPQNYQSIINDLKLEDIIVKDKEHYQDLEIQNNIRRTMYQKFYRWSLLQMLEYVGKQDYLTYEEKIVKVLITNICIKEKKYKKELYELLIADKFEEAYSLLDNIKDTQLSTSNLCIKKMLKDIIIINDTGIIPENNNNNNNDDDDIFEAIKNNDYELAYKLSCEYVTAHKISSNIINLLLKKLYILIGYKDEVLNDEYNININYNSLYDTKSISALINYILSSNMDIDSIGEKLRLDEDEVNYIKLIFVKEYYSRGYNYLGDSLFKVVEKSKNKSKKINLLLNEVRKNKKFYNTPNPDLDGIPLTLKPKKRD